MNIRLFTLIITTLFLAACNTEEKQTVKVGGRYFIELPGSFKEAKELNEAASLQYQDLGNEFYVIVIDEPKDVLEKALFDNALESTYTPDINGYSKLVIEGIDPSVAIDSVPPFTEGTVGGLKSREISFTGISQGYHIYWKFAFVEGKNRYYQIMLWTMAENRDKREKDMQEIIRSFRETDKSKSAK